MKCRLLFMGCLQLTFFLSQKSEKIPSANIFVHALLGYLFLGETNFTNCSKQAVVPCGKATIHTKILQTSSSDLTITRKIQQNLLPENYWFPKKYVDGFSFWTWCFTFNPCTPFSLFFLNSKHFSYSHFFCNSVVTVSSLHSYINFAQAVKQN